MSFLGALPNCQKRLLGASWLPVCPPVCPPVCLPFRMEQLGSHWTDFHEVWYLKIFRKSVEKVQGSLKSDKHKGYFTSIPIYFFIISRSFLLRMTNISDKFLEKIKTHILCSVIFFYENLSFMKKMWKNIVERGRPQMTIWHMRISGWIPKATNKHTYWVILIDFPLQQWFHDASQCHVYTYIASLVNYLFIFK